MIESITRARAVILEDDKVLLIHRIKEGREYYVLPGGGVEPGESAHQAVRRECNEELGIDVEPGELMFTIPITATSEKSTSSSPVEAFFRCTKISGTIGSGNGPEFTERTNNSNQYLPELIDLSKVGGLPVLPEAAKARLLAQLLKTGES